MEIQETEFNDQLDKLHSRVRELASDNFRMQEDLDRTKAQYDALQYEDIGWKLINGGGGFDDDNTGITISTLHTVAKKLREEVAGSALPKRANEARYSYTFGKAFIIPGLDQPGIKKPGKKDALNTFYLKPTVQRYVFSEEAQVAMHAASSTDGCYILVGDNATKDTHAIPVTQITDVYMNPDYNDEIWAYQRTWTSVDYEGKTVEQSKWILTDRFPSGQKPPETIGETRVPVDESKTIIDAVFNNQVGWPLGIPDLMAGQIWNRKYITMIAYGEQVTETLAYFAAKVKSSSKSGAKEVGVQTAKGGSMGNVVSYGEGNSVDVFNTAGRTYDFGGLRIFASFYAAAAGVTLTDLTADPSSAGASYGSAAALMPGARRSIEARRAHWAAWYSRVIKWATGKDVTVVPESIMEEDEYRTAQKMVFAWNTGLYHEDEIRSALASVAGITLKHDTPPENVLLPNNSDSWERADIDPKEDPSTSSNTAPGQGQKNGTGGQDDSQKKDMRSDTISSERLAHQMSLEHVLELIENAIKEHMVK